MRKNVQQSLPITKITRMKGILFPSRPRMISLLVREQEPAPSTAFFEFSLHVCLWDLLQKRDAAYFPRFCQRLLEFGR